MMNYVKSEMYRISHDKGIYFFTFILAFLSCLLNAVLGCMGIIDGASFPYDTTSFSYSNLVANPMMFCVMGTVVGFLLYDGNRKNGNLKNTIAFGISRTQIFIGECIVAAVTASVILIVGLVFYIGSAMIFLEHIGPVSLNDLLTEIPAVFFIAIAALVSGIVCMGIFEKGSTGIIIWFLIWFAIPQIFYYLGFRFDIFHRIALWMPANFFGIGEMQVDLSQSLTAWGTAKGMAKCMISGISGTMVFLLLGIRLWRKKEV
ncbi:MAG: ABC transporter permease [Lachnospiraceae bacterium]